MTRSIAKVKEFLSQGLVPSFFAPSICAPAFFTTVVWIKLSTVVPMVLLFLSAFLPHGGGAYAADGLERFEARVVNTYPHDPEAYTQGLFFGDGALIETTGQFGQSSLRRVEIETGKVLEKIKLPDQFFGEGSVMWQDRIINLTWRSGKGFIFSKDGFKKLGQFTYEGEGWGLTHNGTMLIMSDGTPRLRFLDPETLQVIRTLNVTYRDRPVRFLNELEWIKGRLFANVYGRDYVVRIDPVSGFITGVIDFSGLIPDQEARIAKGEVLNGIAYDAGNDRLFVTGKYWPKLFEVELVPVGGGN
ncbi:MAG: glutaminyl-peptide cyclotransferase [Pseudomonadota bacterium]